MTAKPGTVNPAEVTPRELNQDPRRLKWRRGTLGLSIRDAAARAHCSPGHLSDLENGNYSASPELLRDLAFAYGCEITDIMPADPAAAAALAAAELARQAQEARQQAGEARAVA